MKRFTSYRIYLAIFLFNSILNPVLFAQTQSAQGSLTKENIRSEADNIGYWMEAARLGLVPYNAPVVVKPGQPIPSRSGAESIEQMTSDVIVWDETNVTQSENSIAIDPQNPLEVLNSNNSEESGSIYGANYINSYSAGQTWSGSKEGAGGANKGDPVAAINYSGRKFIGYITSGRGQGISYSDNGTTWTAVNIDGPYSYPDLMDKNHLTVDPRPSGTYSGYVYSAWSHFQSGNANDNEIVLSRSTNNGVSWSTPTNISAGVSAGSHNQGVNLQTGPTGQVYAVWVIYDDWGTAGIYGEDAIGFNRSLNGGSSFGTATRIHDNILGIRPQPATATTNPTGKNMRVNSFPSMAVDISGGPYNGYIYVVWANVGIPGTNTGTNVSIYCMRSTNGGVSWGTPVRVNQGTTANDYASFFPWITCDPVTGKLYCVFYDDRSLGSTSSDVETWVAYSEDGGLSWDDFRVSDVSFTPAPIPGLAVGYFGDYLGISARDNYVYPIWTDNRNSTAETYVSPIEFTDYCIATGGCDEYISNVSIGSINNSSSCEQYSNYTELSTNVMKGSSHNLTVTIGNNLYTGDDVQVWVDWNKDGDFMDANEDIGFATGIGPHTFSVNVPEDILIGKCTMRVRLSWSGTPPLSPCGSTAYGEVEDYSLNVNEYCLASGGCDEYISNVQIGSINNSSGCDGYWDYTNLSANIDLLSSATVTVTNGLPIYTGDQCGIWVDWNRDNDFDDANETITVTGSPGVGPYTALIDPPAGIYTGPCTMRIRITWTGAVSPCGTTTYGEVEDYTIMVSGPNYWLGHTSHDWADPSNWSLGYIPNSLEDVLIPATYTYNPIIHATSTYGASSGHLTIQSGATLTINNGILIVYGNADITGSLEMINNNAELRVEDNINWYSGSTASVTASSAEMYIKGTWDYLPSSSVHLDMGYVEFTGTSSSYIRSRSNDSYFYHVRLNKDSPAELGHSAQSTYPLEIHGNLYQYAGSKLTSYTPQSIVLDGFFNNMGGDIQLGNGTFIFDGNPSGIPLKPNTGDYFNNLTVSSTTTLSLGSDYSTTLDINGDMLIETGAFSPGSFTIMVEGNWTNNAGTGGFLEGTSRVVFDGPGHQYVNSDETFNILEAAMGAALRPGSNAVTCAVYDWTSGGIDVLDGTFTANDLFDNGLYGGFWVNPGGTINLVNSGTGTYVDLNGELHNFGGTINITGSISWWPYYDNATIEMTGGVIDFKTCGIYIYDTPTYSLNDNITGGVIKTAFGFSGNRADFQPTEGTFEFYSNSDAIISQSNGCTLHNVVINKGAAKDNGLTIPSYSIPESAERKDNTLGEGGKDLNLTLGSDFTLSGNLEITDGTLNLGGHHLVVAKNMDVYGTLNMINAADILTVGTDLYENLDFHPGSSGNLQEGNINIYNWIVPKAGSSMIASTNNTIHFVGNNGNGGLGNNEPSTLYGNVEVNKTANPIYLDGDATETIPVGGDFILHPGNVLRCQLLSMHVQGTMTDDATSEIHVSILTKGDSKDSEETGEEFIYSSPDPEIVVPSDSLTAGAKGGFIEMDQAFTQTGLIEIGDGDVLVHGSYLLSPSGILNIDGGSLICDAPTGALTTLGGTFGLTTGLLESTNRPMNFGSSSTTFISGGVIRVGGTFAATTAGTFVPTGGQVELFGPGPAGSYIQVNSGCHFHDLIIDRTNSIDIYTGYDLNIANDLLIQSGGLNTNSRDIYIAGNWTNNAGPDAFLETTGKVVFNGPGHQYVYSDETFNVIEANMGNALRVPSSTVICNEYDWTTGGVDVLTGTFTALDLTDNGLFGGFWVNPGGTINLYQDPAQYVDINCILNFAGGGTINVYGGSDYSYWPFAADATINMTGGLLFFDGPGILIPPPSGYTLTYTITGGIIRTSGSFYGQNGLFTPTSGSFEFTGLNDATLQQSSGCTLFNVDIDKSFVKGSSAYPAGGISPRSGFKFGPGSKDNTVALGTGFTVTNDLNVNQGTLDLNGFTLTVENDVDINSGGTLTVPGFSIIELADLSTMSVNSGGILEMLGDFGFEATITRISTGNYGLDIFDGGILRAQYSVFEYMNGNGVNLSPGSVVDPAFSFNNCTFRNGAAGGRLITAGMTSSITASETVFPTNTWGGSYNVYKENDAGQIVFLNASGGFEGEAYENDPYNRVFWDIPPTAFEFTVFLEGPFNPSTLLMEPGLFGQLPTLQPYGPILPYYGNAMPDWYYTGLESVGAIPDPNIIDWVVVELRDAPTAATALPATAVARKAGFLKSNGKIVDLDGISMLTFAVIPVNDLFAVVWHRNHTGIMSNALPLGGGAVSYDFTIGSGQVYGGGSAHKLLGGTIWGMIAGDADGSGWVDMVDKTNAWDAIAGKHGYLPADFNFDQQSDNRDKNDFLLENLGTGSAIPE